MKPKTQSEHAHTIATAKHRKVCACGREAFRITSGQGVCERCWKLELRVNGSYEIDGAIAKNPKREKRRSRAGSGLEPYKLAPLSGAEWGMNLD